MYYNLVKRRVTGITFIGFAQIQKIGKHGVGSDQFLSVNIGVIRLLSVNIGVIRLLSVITTTPSSKNNVSLINTGPSIRH